MSSAPKARTWRGVATTLSKGQNGPVAVHDLIISVDLPVAADVSALLLKADGTVRSDADFVFFNQPVGPGVQLLRDTSDSRISITLASVPDDVTQIRAVVTLDDATSTFGRSAAPIARVSGPEGTLLYEYPIEGLTTESVVIALEVYRREAGWKVRAVGQGYAEGFAALVADHGVSVGDAPDQRSAPEAVTSAPPPGPPSAPTFGTPPSAPTFGTPPSTAPPAPAAPAEVNLAKGRPVSLVKGQRVSLRKEGGVSLTHLVMGLGWDPVTSRGVFGNRTPDIDLDASAILCADDAIIDAAYFGQLISKDGSVRHQGDNLTGEGDGDDEVVLVDLQRVPPHVSTILFVVTSYKGHTFTQVSNAFCRLVDGTTNAELARYSLQGGMDYTGMVMAKVYRVGSEWKLQAIGEGIQAKHPGEAAPQLGRFVGA